MNLQLLTMTHPLFISLARLLTHCAPALCCLSAHCHRRLVQRVGHYLEIVLQEAGTYKAVTSQQQTVRVKSVRLQLHVLLCDLFFGPNKLKMWEMLEAEAGQVGNGDQADAGLLFEGADGEDPAEVSSSRQAEARQKFLETVLRRTGTATRPADRQMVCHRDLADYQEGQLMPDDQVVYHRVGEMGNLPQSPRCICYNCINVLHLFHSTASRNAKTGRTKHQMTGRKRRHAMSDQQY